MGERVHLVTGATGFSGSHVIAELLKAGRKVIGTDLAHVLKDPDHMEVIRQSAFDPNHPNLELVPSNLLEPGSLEPLFERRPSHVFHTASLYDYSAPLTRLKELNVTGTRNLLKLAKNARLERFVHWSTCGVFGKPYTAADGSRVNVPFTEESSSPKTAPESCRGPQGTKLVNDYSISKWEQEQFVWKAAKEGLPVTVIRPAPIYGPGGSYGHGGIILVIAQGLLPIIPLDTRNYITTSVHVRDVARFALHIADRPEAVGEDYNVVDNSIISYYEFLTYIALLTGRRMLGIPFIPLERMRPVFVAAATGWTWLQQRLGVPRVRVFEVQSATYVSSSYWLSNRKGLETGFQFLYSDVKEGLKDTVDWMRRQRWLLDRSRLMKT